MTHALETVPTPARQMIDGYKAEALGDADERADVALVREALERVAAAPERAASEIGAAVFAALARLEDDPATLTLAAGLVAEVATAVPALGTQKVRRGVRMARKKEVLSHVRIQPYEPYELNGSAGPGSSDPATTLRAGSTSPAGTGLGQNQIADLIAGDLADRVAWDETSGAWFERTAVDAPFRERPPLVTWETIRRACERHQDSFTASFVNGVETFLRATLAVDGWESARHLLPLANGVVDLGTRELRPYAPADRFDWALPYGLDPAARCPLIDATIRRMVGGNEGLERFLLAWLLIVLLGRADVQAFVELVGDGGTGKSTFLALARHLVGDENTHATSLEQLENNRFETASLRGKRLVLVTDSARYRGDVPTLKAITGGDPVRLERKHQQQRRPFVFGGLVMIAANQPLESSDYSSGLSRRRRSLEIGYRVSDEEKAPYFDTARYPDGFEGALRDEMPGLLNRLLALDVGDAVELVHHPDEAMRAQRLAIELETNPLLAWADEALVRCEPGEESQVGQQEKDPTRALTRGTDPDRALYPNYRRHVEARGQHPVSSTRFSRAACDVLRSYGLETEKERPDVTILTGLRLRRPEDPSGRLLSDPNLASDGADRRVVAGSNGATEGFAGFAGSSQPPTPDDAEEF